MKRFLPHFVWLSGLLVVLIGIAVGPVVPYQDPTPEMRTLEARQEQRSQRVAITGLCLFAGGVLWGTSRWLMRRFSRRAVT
jgi:hypothetical protein